MKVVIQRVLSASVAINGEVFGECQKGLCLFVGIENGDSSKIAEKVADKIYKMRIFEDGNGKTNLSAADIAAEALVISQFTLCADIRRGNRPSFINAAPPETAKTVYEYFIKLCSKRFSSVGCGIFGADMKVSLVNDGPFTIILDSKMWEI